MKQFISSIDNFLLRYKSLWLYGVLGLLLIYLLPLYIYGGSLHYLAFDNMDSNVVWYKILAESGKIFAENNATIPNMMGGLPRSTYGSEFNIILWLYYFFKPINAYVINETIIHLVAFLSMFIFLKHTFFRKNTPYDYIAVCVGALYFATLPFLPSSGGLSVPLIPLVLYSLFKIRDHTDRWYHWLLFIFLPLYSDFILVYLFFYTAFMFYMAYLLVSTKKINYRLLFAVCFSVGLFLLKDYRLVLSMLIEHNFVSHRSEYYSLVNKTFWDAYRSAHIEFINGVPHAKEMHLLLVLPLSILVTLLTLTNKRFSYKYTIVFSFLFFLSVYFDLWTILLTQKYSLPALLVFLIMVLKFGNSKLPIAKLLIAQIAIAYWFGFSFYEGWHVLFSFFPPLEMLNFSRFFFIAQPLWAVIAALSIYILLTKFQYATLLIPLFLAAQLWIAKDAAFFSTTQKLYFMPFDKYYAVNQFRAIKNYIGKPQSSYRVISLGIEPAVSLYNGFHTVDGQSANYPLVYKHSFRRIIQMHLEKDKKHRELYDGWGNKVYLFDNEVGYSYRNENDVLLPRKPYNGLDFNSTQIYKMGGRYLFSSRKITDAKQKNLLFEKKFSRDSHTLWKVWLYRVKALKKGNK